MNQGESTDYAATVVVRSREELDQLLAERQLARRFRTLSIPSLKQSPQGRRIERALNRHWQSCGCTAGAAASGIAILLAVIAAAVGYPGIDNFWAVSLAFVVGSAFTGKLAGVLFSRWRLSLWVTRARQVLPASRGDSLSLT